MSLTDTTLNYYKMNQQSFKKMLVLPPWIFLLWWFFDTPAYIDNNFNGFLRLGEQNTT